MKKALLSSVLLISVASTANAGFFDSFFGGDEKKTQPSQETAVKATDSANSTAEMVSTAIALIPTLTNQLGVTENQAQGGLGSLMNFAKSSLSNDEFSQLSAGVPGMDSLLAAAPEITQNDTEKALSGMLSKVGGDATKIAGMDMLNKQFESLGLNTEMIGEFAKLAMSYFSGQEGDTAALLQKGLATLLG